MTPSEPSAAAADGLAQDSCGVALATILDSLDALIYVADFDTHELLFLNAYGRERWGEPAGRRCWEVLQADQRGPCSFCTNPQLLQRPTEPLVWEFQNTVDGRWYQCRDQVMRWADGRAVRVEVATDISERKWMEEELRLARQQAELLARTDELTRLNNRRAFYELGEAAFRQAARRGEGVAVVMFDVDHFKRINDSFGHTVGDEVLCAIAAAARAVCRDTDVLGRLGGEEFALVSPGADAAQALALAERLRAAIAAIRIARDAGELTCTASFGVASYGAGSAAALDALICKADQALFLAKRGGRNRVESLPPNP